MIKTDFTIDGKELSYELLDGDSGYVICLDGNPWIKQTNFIPVRKDTMAESCLAHIQKIVEDAQAVIEEATKAEETAQNATDALERVTLLEEVVDALFELVNFAE